MKYKYVVTITRVAESGIYAGEIYKQVFTKLTPSRLVKELNSAYWAEAESEEEDLLK